MGTGREIISAVLEEQQLVSSSDLFLDQVGQVNFTLNSTALSWKPAGSIHNEQPPSTCLGIKLVPKSEMYLKLSDVYGVEFINFGKIRGSFIHPSTNHRRGRDSEMYRFTVHAIQKSQSQPSNLVMAMYTFGHKDVQTCQMWFSQMIGYLNMEARRPRSLLVFVHPLSGKGKGCRVWEDVAPIFSRARVKTKVIVTERAGHAFYVMDSITNKEINTYDGVVAVGGDGFFNEILNGLLSSKHKTPYPPAPEDFLGSENNKLTQPNIGIQQNSGKIEQDAEFTIPSEHFRFGIIPAGSTDAIVICTTGARDPVTSALHIVLGEKVSLDIAQIVRWKATSSSNYDPCVRYAASFAGYGFYGDIISESEKYRWMGPKRYDYAGAKVFLKHRSYEAEITCLDVKSEDTYSSPAEGPSGRKSETPTKLEKVVCRINCTVCSNPYRSTIFEEESRWLRMKGRYISVGAAVISCRNQRAPDGLIANAHLSDGFLHLILIKDCPHAFYLWHLTELARKNGNPLKFEFVEHHKTRAFTFTSLGREGVWNLDGELFHAHKLSAQVHRGLINLFATGPEV